ncbi:MAG: histidinol-phosphate transaminase [Bacteroidales bacterium]|nr:histidinol-phosphate transaminase [Bacteroidales bacterium]
MENFNIDNLVRENIKKLKPYSSARSEFSGNASVFLDANENPFDTGFNRYPDPLQRKLKEKLSFIKGVASENIFLGNGSDEAIDLVYRVFCNPGKDNVIAPDPTYGMYEVCAEINDIEYRKVNLDADFDIDVDSILAKTDENTKVIFICSPNNPTGNLMTRSKVIRILDNFKGIVVVDEAYIDFASEKSLSSLLTQYPNLIIFQTFSKAWGLASIRLGIAFASSQIISYYNKVKYPYNVNILTQSHALEILDNEEKVKEDVDYILKEREEMINSLKDLSYVIKVYPTDSNFILVKVKDANFAYDKLMEKGVVVRNRNKITLCSGCLRITVGTENENNNVIDVLSSL